MKLIILITIVLATSALTAVVEGKKTKWHQLNISYNFKQYQQEFNKVYESETEKIFRKHIFQQRLKIIIAHNDDSSQTYKRGVNHFTDHTPEELKQSRGLHKGLLYQGHQERRKLQSMKVINSTNSLPESIDWRTKNVLTPIKNQGECGSCWTFASTETLESHTAIKTGILQELSEQFILGKYIC